MATLVSPAKAVPGNFTADCIQEEAYITVGLFLEFAILKCYLDIKN